MNTEDCVDNYIWPKLWAKAFASWGMGMPRLGDDTPDTPDDKPLTMIDF
jgi:hypothetical protein